jgi:pyruvate,water dikinase
MGWILPPGGVPELAHTISRNLYGRAPKELTPPEQDVVVAWIAGRAPVTEAEVRRDLLTDWTAKNDDRGTALTAHNGGPPPPSSTAQTRSVGTSALGVRLGQLATASKPTTTTATTTTATPWTANKDLTLWEGASKLDDRATFDTLGKLGSLPGVGPMREVKFLITGVADGAPVLRFMNTNAYEAHHAFAKGALGAADSLQDFNGRAYFDAHRDVVCGSVVAIDGAAGTTFALQFLPTDPMTTALVAMAAKAVVAQAPFLADSLVYHPVGQGQQDVASRGGASLQAAGVDVIDTKTLLGGVTFAPLNQGVGYGVLRLIDGRDPRPPTAKDVVIFSRLPNDLSHTAGVITLDPQTPLSHVNLKAKQNGTPNAYIQGADGLRDVKQLIGSVVRFEVTANGYTLRAATGDEAASHMESLRPTTSTTPPRDLSVRTPRPLSAIGHKDLGAFGAKSVNAAELMKVLGPAQRMDGVAVPFAFYVDFMKASGLEAAATAMMAEPRFQSDETYRHSQLSKFRRQLRDTPLPAALQQQVKDTEAGFGAGAALRLRSSTNNEDLEGFNGAGLYSSRTWDPAATSTAQKHSFGDVMKDVWSSLWSFRAFEERTFHKIDHLTTAMGVLVHPSYDNDGAAGVAVTKNIYDPNSPGLYVNVQPGDDLVTSPEGGVVPEELLLRQDARTGTYETQVLRQSSLHDGAVLSPAHRTELASTLDAIQQHFRGVYGAHGDTAFAMDVEFIVDADRIRVLQARPWVD